MCSKYLSDFFQIDYGVGIVKIWSYHFTLYCDLKISHISGGHLGFMLIARFAKS